MSDVQYLVVEADEDGMRLDRYLRSKFPKFPQSLVQKLCRTGQLRVEKKRAKPDTRVSEGQSVRVPPVDFSEAGEEERKDAHMSETEKAFRKLVIYEDDALYVLNKPVGLAVQGGSGLTRHVDGMLEAMKDKKGQKPRLVHRLDRETSGVLVIAKTRKAAQFLTECFKHRDTEKTYIALVYGCPKPLEGRISNFLKKFDFEGEDRMRPAKHGEKGAQHAETMYEVLETSANRLSLVKLKPVTGRMHQLRAHMRMLGCPIIGDSKYFNIENWELPGGMQNKLHLHALSLSMPHPNGRDQLIVSAPLAPHIKQSTRLLGLDDI